MHPDAHIFSSLPGAGPILAPRLLAAMGSDRSRFNSSEEVAKYSGIAPVTERSGKAKWVHRRFACSRFVLQSFHEFAGQSILQCDWARAYYDHKKAEGKGHQAWHPGSCLQVDPHHLSLLERSCSLQRAKVHGILRQKRPSWLASPTAN